MFIQNKDSFFLDEKFYFNQFIPFIDKKEESDWKIKYLKIRTNEVLFHNTNDNDELIIILSGNGGITINGESSLTNTGDIVHCPKNTIRSIANIKNEDLHAIIITIY